MSCGWLVPWEEGLKDRPSGYLTWRCKGNEYFSLCSLASFEAKLFGRQSLPQKGEIPAHLTATAGERTK
jgi:hypothetical protein